MTKSKLEQAVERQAACLSDAQRELVMSQFSTYKRNRARMSQIEERMKALDAGRASGAEDARLRQSERASLSYEHGQLAATNNGIAAKLFVQLDGTGNRKDEED